MKKIVFTTIAFVFVFASCVNSDEREMPKEWEHEMLAPELMPTLELEPELTFDLHPEPFPEANPYVPFPPYLPQPEEMGFVVGEPVRFAGRDWRVLNVEGRYALLLHETVLPPMHYHHISRPVTWAESSAREWLNGPFLNRFSADDVPAIRETFVVNNDNPWTFHRYTTNNRYFEQFDHTPGGVATIDRIFLLSLEEVTRYLGGSELLELGRDEINREDRLIPGLYYAFIAEDIEIRAARRAYNAEGAPSWWWLRSPGFVTINAAVVYDDGRIRMYGTSVIAPYTGFRPALWLNLEYFVLGANN